jgi:purple acid phosphatase-like protein/calcineurin-like phosphoesterase family protein/TAT (twin-arginine translocation) pathway-exported protein
MRTAVGNLPERLWRDMSMAEAHDYLRARSTRRQFLKGAAGVGAAIAAGPLFFARAARAAGTPAGVHVNVGSDPSEAITISWSTPGIVDAPRVEIGTDLTYGTTLSAETRSVAGVATLYHHAAATGLSPETRYYYRASYDGADAPATGSFTTAPRRNAPFRFVALGDMGANADAVLVTSRIVAAQPDCVFLVGDLCYADRLGGSAEPPPEFPPGQPLQDLSQWDAFFAQIQASASQVPWIPTVGNHEMEVGQGALGYDGFRARVVLPGGSGAPTFYVTRWSNVAFVALDANDVSTEIRKNQGYTGGAQNGWLGETLAALRADPSIDFIVVGFHHCMYCSNTVHASDGGVRDAWLAFFDEHGVDVVINGHNHSYERTHAMRGGQIVQLAPIGAEIDPCQHGTVYVTAGAGGQAAYPSTLYPLSYVTIAGGVRVPETADWSAVRYLGDHSLLVVDVAPAGAGPARMDVVAIAKSDGHEVDRFSIVRRDSDCDGFDDPADNCALRANPGQQDRGGVASTAPDGIGDACQCGDVTGNGIVNGQDANAIQRHGLGLEPNPLFAEPGNCDVTGNALCNGQDANAVKRAALGHPSPLFGQNCHNATGEPLPPGF